MNILAIETSCDETALALIRIKKGGAIDVLSNLVSSQVALHMPWGGVVPNLAKREHEKALVPLFLKTIFEASTNKAGSMNYELRKKNKFPISYFVLHNSILEKNEELRKQFEKNIIPMPRPKIDTIAVTGGPGLEPALWTGVSFARALSVLWNIPLLGINHMEGHIVSALLQQSGKISHPKGDPPPADKKVSKSKIKNTNHYTLRPVAYPALALLVSGGHTELVLMPSKHRRRIIGETRDDAAGEAFDKTARLLGLGYPGGPLIAKETKKMANFTLPEKLPRPMIRTKDYDFSFSGLKTAVLYLVRDLTHNGIALESFRPAICREFQNAAVDVLVAKTVHAARRYNAKTVLLGGGVAANIQLRKQLAKEIKEQMPSAVCHVPSTHLTGDNALMIAAAAALRPRQAKKHVWKTLTPDANLSFPRQ